MGSITFTYSTKEKIVHHLLQHHEVLTILYLLFYFDFSFWMINSHQALKYNTFELPSRVSGPESITFDCNGDGPYTGISDGRILKWQGSKHGWKEFAITSPFR